MLCGQISLSDTDLFFVPFSVSMSSLLQTTSDQLDHAGAAAAEKLSRILGCHILHYQCIDVY